MTQAFDVWYLLIPGTPGLRFEKNRVRIALIVRCSKVASTNEFDAAAMRGQLSLAFRVLAPRSVTVANQLTKLSDSSPFTRKHLGSSPQKPPLALVNQDANDANAIPLFLDPFPLAKQKRRAPEMSMRQYDNLEPSF